jgi:hypothetical protein
MSVPGRPATAAGGQGAYQRGGKDGGGQDALQAARVGMGMHGELLWLEESGVETTRYASSCTNHAKIFQARFKTPASVNSEEINRFIINGIWR